LEMARLLKEKGFLVPAIRPPTVPPKGSRLRLSLSAAHDSIDIDRFIDVMATLAPQFAKAQTA
jgi:8-amino-7-oxononanoate synthase